MKKVIGLTGGIASGKSFVSNYLIDLGYEVIDSDKISKELSNIGMSLYNAIVMKFGKNYLNEDNSLNRNKLGKLVFNDNESMKMLNEITHPLIIEEIIKRIKKSDSNMIFLDIPLLFEAKLEYLCDKIVCVYVDKKTQIKRLMNRDNIDRKFALKKIDSQMSLTKKKNISDYVIYSLDDFNMTKANVDKILLKLKGI